tara:strand:- start:3696 stop:5138 length:1443 start_codon:yes stop_codon:yes gene_type:complete
MVIKYMLSKFLLTKIKTHSPFIGIVALLFLFSFLNLPVLATLWRHSFDDGTYSHAYLIPFITLYLYYQLQADNLLAYKSHFSLFGFLLFVASCYGLFVSVSAQISVGYWLSSLGVVISAIIMLYEYHWRVIFPAAFLILIIPMWGPIALILQSISVNAVNFMMGFTGIPTYVEGNFVSIPAGVFEIADGCSGLRYFIVSIAISSLYVFLNMKNTRNITLFISVAIIGALVTNWIRITLLIIIGDYTDMTSSLMTDHNNFGWFIFAPFMILLFIFGNYLTDSPLKQTVEAKLNTSTTVLFSSVLLILTGLLFSSTTISNSLIAEKNLISNSLDNFNKELELKPFIQYYSNTKNTELIINNQKIIIKTFNFSGYDLDSKPTFYTNKVAPDSWRVINSFQHKQWNITELNHRNKKSLIATSLQLNGQLYANKSDFKLARIKAGLLGTKATKLYWFAIHCKTNCELEKISLTTVLDDFNVVDAI